MSISTAALWVKFAGAVTMLIGSDMLIFNMVVDYIRSPLNTSTYEVVLWTGISLLVVAVLLFVTSLAMRARSWIPPCACCCVCGCSDTCYAGWLATRLYSDRRIIKPAYVIIRTCSVVVSCVCWVFFVAYLFVVEIYVLLAVTIVGSVSLLAQYVVKLLMELCIIRNIERLDREAQKNEWEGFVEACLNRDGSEF